MNTIKKYIIYFLLGIIAYYLLFSDSEEDLVEGLCVDYIDPEFTPDQPDDKYMSNGQYKECYGLEIPCNDRTDSNVECLYRQPWTSQTSGGQTWHHAGAKCCKEQKCVNRDPTNLMDWTGPFAALSLPQWCEQTSVNNTLWPDQEEGKHDCGVFEHDDCGSGDPLRPAGTCCKLVDIGSTDCNRGDQWVGGGGDESTRWKWGWDDKEVGNWTSSEREEDGLGNMGVTLTCNEGNIFSDYDDVTNIRLSCPTATSNVPQTPGEYKWFLHGDLDKPVTRPPICSAPPCPVTKVWSMISSGSIHNPATWGCKCPEDAPLWTSPDGRVAAGHIDGRVILPGQENWRCRAGRGTPSVAANTQVLGRQSDCNRGNLRVGGRGTGVVWKWGWDDKAVGNWTSSEWEEDGLGNMGVTLTCNEDNIFSDYDDVTNIRLSCPTATSETPQTPGEYKWYLNGDLTKPVTTPPMCSGRGTPSDAGTLPTDADAETLPADAETPPAVGDTTSGDKMLVNLKNKLKNSNFNSGCSHYTCKNDPITYDNYEEKIGSSDPFFNNCSNLREEEYIHGNFDFIPCSNEICCDNHICKTKEANINCHEGQTFLPNKICTYSINVGDDDTCNESICCENIQNEELSGLFDDIIKFRDDHGGNSNNGANITGEDIMYYLYSILIDLAKTSDENKIKDPLPTDLFLVFNNINDYINYSTPLQKEHPKIIYPNSDNNLPLNFGNNKTYSITVNQNQIKIKLNTDHGHLRHEGGSNIESTLNEILSDNTLKETYGVTGVTGVAIEVKSIELVVSYFDQSGKLMSYYDYGILSKWISNIKDDNIDKLKLNTEFQTHLDPGIPISHLLKKKYHEGEGDNLTTTDIKKMIRDLDKVYNIEDTDYYVKPLDTFYHTYLNENKNSVIDKNMFIALINYKNS